MPSFGVRKGRFVVVKEEADINAHTQAPPPPLPPTSAQHTPGAPQSTQLKPSLIVKLKLPAQRPQPSKVAKLHIRPSNIVGVANPSNAEPTVRQIRARIELLERHNAELARQRAATAAAAAQPQQSTSPARPPTHPTLPPTMSPARKHQSKRKGAKKGKAASAQQDETKTRPETAAPPASPAQSSTASTATGHRSSTPLELHPTPTSNAPHARTPVARTIQSEAQALGVSARELQQAQQSHDAETIEAALILMAMSRGAPPGYGAFNPLAHQQQLYTAPAAPSVSASASRRSTAPSMPANMPQPTTAPTANPSSSSTPPAETKDAFVARFGRLHAGQEAKAREQAEWDEAVAKSKKEFDERYPGADEELMVWREERRPGGWRYEE